MALKTVAKVYLNELKEKWQLLHNTPTVFAYNLNVSQRKYLPGTWHFYSELNPERTALRRPPQTIAKLCTAFDEEKFNFRKVKPIELIMDIPYEGVTVSMIINRSPLTRYHTLICPDVAAGLPQHITLLSLSFSVALLRGLMEDKNHAAYRIGYNSPGALASVNHLHLHLLEVETDLYIDQAQLELLAATHIYRLSAHMPTEAICFLIHQDDSEQEVCAKLQGIYEYLMWLCVQNMPHNLFITAARNGQVGDLKVFVYAREKYCIIKQLSQYNIGFCELAGLFPIGDAHVFPALTEQQVITKIREEAGDAYQRIYKYFRK